jgi:tetratricopeptide (TPR) repeat protein
MLDRDTILDRDICDDFLVYLCKMRSNQARQCEDDPNVFLLEAIFTLARVYACQGLWKEAKELHVQVMETRKRVEGEEHPDTLMSMSYLADVYQNQGRRKEAEELEVQVMETRKRVLGQEHPDTLLSMRNLAFIFKSQGRRDEAITLLEKVVALLPQRLGENHPHSKMWINTLKEWRDNRNAVST